MTSAQRSRPGSDVGAMRRLYRGQTNFDFINRWRYWFALSGAIIAVGLVALGVRGLNFSIDFKGGVQWQVPTNASVATVRADVGKISPLLGQSVITQLTNRQTGLKEIQVEGPSALTTHQDVVTKVTAELAKLAHRPVNAVTLSAIGPSWGSSITHKAVEAVIVFIVLLFIAISAYFETKMAVAAIIAAVHDMLVTIGIYALSGFQVSPDTVIAFLTVLGYSLYDTIVVFDKVKENTRGLASTNRVTYTDVVNLSMNQVLARSVNTSFVAIMPVFCILVIGSWILGAAALNDFGLALFIGLVSGAYSSIFIASPILALLKEREPRYTEIRRRLAAYPQARQILTAATVADGVLIGAPRSSAEPWAAQGAGKARPAVPAEAFAGAGVGAGALPASSGGRAGAGASAHPGSAGVEGAPDGGESGGTTNGESVGGAARGPEGSGARAVRSPAGGGRAVPPRPRKKAPRRR